jgi:predicted Rossmann fold flavoprotein
MKIAVIGAGASGMAAVLQAAWKGAAVTVFERNASVGRKLLVTGSGRCNLTNDAVSAMKYACADQAWMAAQINQFGVSDVLEMLARIGIPVHKTDDGWYYPLSNSAQSVVEAFSSALNMAGATICTQSQVSSISASRKKFTVRFIREGSEQETEFERVIVSAGGAAYPSLGSRGELFPVLDRLGHTVLPNRPALAPLLVELAEMRPLQGTRLDVSATLWNQSRQVAATSGNLIFTEWGLNGPAVMDISHHVSAHPQSKLTLSLNLLAPFQAEFDRFLAQQRTSQMPVRVFLGAFFPPKVTMLYLKITGLPADTSLSQLDDSDLHRLVARLRDTRFTVKGVREFDFCQVSAGGVPVVEVDVCTMESRLVQGLYLTGETLDVVGPCGGYNLQFAFSSGALAGIAAAKIKDS